MEPIIAGAPKPAATSITARMKSRARWRFAASGLVSDQPWMREPAPKWKTRNQKPETRNQEPSASADKQGLQMPHVDVLRHVAADYFFVRLEQVEVAAAGLGGELEADVQELAQAGVELRVTR